MCFVDLSDGCVAPTAEQCQSREIGESGSAGLQLQCTAKCYRMWMIYSTVALRLQTDRAWIVCLSTVGQLSGAELGRPGSVFL